METLRNIMTSHCKKLQHKFADVCPACTKRAQTAKNCCRTDFKPQGLWTIFDRHLNRMEDQMQKLGKMASISQELPWTFTQSSIQMISIAQSTSVTFSSTSIEFDSHYFYFSIISLNCILQIEQGIEELDVSHHIRPSEKKEATKFWKKPMAIRFLA